jgi:shikimate dehydrogenase
MPSISTQTQMFGIMGRPIGHSLSPIMHNAAFDHLAYPGVYLAFEVSDVVGALAGMRALNVKGFSVTIPHKTAVMAYLDDIDEPAAGIGAVNTVLNKNGRLIGTNTDCHGAITALSAVTALSGMRVAVLGAGGAARAVGFGLKQEKALVTLYNRSIEKGAALAGDLGIGFAPLAEFDGRDTDILINTTSVGMMPDVAATPIRPATLHAGMVVMDIVYNPLQTRLLTTARRQGCITIDGVAMFVHQGARQFELWTGLPAPVDVMRRAVLAVLGNKE